MATLRTSISLMTRPSKEMVEIRFRNEVTLSLEGIQEIFRKLDHHSWAAPTRLLVILPDHPMDFDLPVISTDHLQGRPDAAEPGRAMAIVARNAANHRFAELHLAHFPIRFTTRLFRSEEEARTWLDAGTAGSPG